MTVEQATNKRVFVADDTSFFRSMLSYILTEQGYDVQTASDGNEAVSVLNDSWNEFDLLILDLMMPGMNGFEVLQKLRDVDTAADLPVLVVTQYYLNDLERQILKKQRIVGYLNKTASMERILFEVNTILYPDEKNVRKAYRAPVNLPVTFRIGTETVISTAFNLSVEGIFIIVQDREPPQVGETLDLKFWVPNTDRLMEMRGEIMWRNGFDDTLKKTHPPGMGVKFINMDDKIRKTMEEFLKSLRVMVDQDD
ncbi:response regulator [Acidobacteriota bacterium]